MLRWGAVVAVLGGVAVACRSSSDRSAPAAVVPSEIPSPRSRPYGLHLPRSWDRRRPAPLVVMLHGYGSSGEEEVRNFGLQQLSDEEAFVLAAPDGLMSSRGQRFWNATDACCDADGLGVDDVGYVAWILDDVASRMPIDPARIYVVGYSNGGFLALRVACDLSKRVAAVVSIAGAGWKDPTRCAPTEAVSVLEIHGDQDAVIRFDGGVFPGRDGRDYPGVLDTVGAWVRRDGCAPSPRTQGAAFNFDDLVAGNETTAQSFAPCRAGSSVELWTVAGGSHMPKPSDAGLLALWTWLSAHAKQHGRLP